MIANNKQSHKTLLTFAIVASIMPLSASADQKYDELKAHVEALQQQLNQVQLVLKQYEQKSVENTKQVTELSKEVAQSKLETKEITEIQKDINAANEWREPNTLIHMSGYADIGYSSDSDSFKVGTFSPIFHYQYRDLVMLEAELELEIEGDGSTAVGLEYATIDIFLNDYVAFIGGRFLSPIGQFRQNMHPSWINKIVSAAPGFGHDGAAPVSEMGFQLRGGFELAGINTNYAFYISNGPELVAAEESEGEYVLEGIDAEGFGRNTDNEKTLGGRLGIIPFAGLEIGVSAATGKATITSIEAGDGGHEQRFIDVGLSPTLKNASEPAVSLHDEQARDYDVLGFDYAYRHNNFQLRGEYVRTKIGDATNGITASEGASWKSWYTQASYLIPQTKWEPVIRYTDFTAPEASGSQEQLALGLDYQFTSSVIGKFTYEFNDGLLGLPTDENRWLLQLAYGF